MSGFVGILNGDGKPVDGLMLQEMTDLMAFRGPDAIDIWCQGFVGFGHTLLRTTWESKNERQPLSFDREIWICGDVRLDRRDELIDLLRAGGRKLDRNIPDVDLILHAYHLWGDACLERLSGDFAFAIWDGLHRRLFCARDQFGIVPFYYTKIGKTLIFSNTLDCLRLHPEVSDRLNEQAIGDFLLFSMNLDVATTTFADIQKLPPAHRLTWTEKGVNIQRYWQLPEAVEYLRYKRREEYVAQFRELFERAVGDRLRTESAGTHLSGGMDSTSIAVTAYKLMVASGNTVDFRAYTSVYKQVIVEEEGDYATQVAEAAGFPIECLAVEDYWQQPPIEQPKFISPEPLLISNQSVEMETNRRVARHSRVLLAGFGGDPAFYPSPSYWYQLLQTGQIQHFMLDSLAYIRCFRRLPRLGLRSGLRRWLKKGDLRQQEIDFPDWFNPDFAERVKLRARLEEILTGPPHRDRYGMATAPLWWNIFAWADPGFSGFPLKVRFPFFDVGLVLYLLSVPPAPWLENKLLLRESMKGVLPDSVRQRPKTPLWGHPRYKFAQQRGVVPWMAELAATPALSSYVNTERLLQKLNALAELTPGSYDRASFALTLAYWLRHQRRPQAKTRQIFSQI